MGILENIKKELKELRREQKVLRDMLTAKKDMAQEAAWLKVADLATRHGVTDSAIDRWLILMAERGYAVTVAQVSDKSPRMICVEQFDRAFRELFAKNGGN